MEHNLNKIHDTYEEMYINFIASFLKIKFIVWSWGIIMNLEARFETFGL